MPMTFVKSQSADEIEVPPEPATMVTRTASDAPNLKRLTYLPETMSDGRTVPMQNQFPTSTSM